MEQLSRKELAMQYFEQGYNCAQSVSLAFADLVPMDRDLLSRLSAPFGGGIGRMREVCGACSGMAMICGMVHGYDGAGSKELKGELYARVQELLKEFEQKNGSIVCRQLLGLEEKRQDPMPQERNAAYYAVRPCKELVGDAAEILEKYLAKE